MERIAVVAASSASIFKPRPIHLPDAIAAASVTRTTSIDKLRSIVALPPVIGIFMCQNIQITSIVT
ncbi:hypothetical protein D3C79_930440 [compost metagenome]